MKKIIILSAIVLGLGFLAVRKPAECSYCPSYRCYGPCGGECSCVTLGGEFGGRCVSVENRSWWLERGYSELK